MKPTALQWQLPGDPKPIPLFLLRKKKKKKTEKLKKKFFPQNLYASKNAGM